MSIKKSVIAVAVFASLSGVSMMANAAPSADVTLEGIITNSTCDVSVNNGLATLNVGSTKQVLLPLTLSRALLRCRLN